MAGLFDTLRSGAWLRPRPPLTETNAGRDNGESKTAVHPSPAFRAMAGGRVSVDRLYEEYSTVTTVEAPPDADSAWRTMNLDRRTLDSLSPARLLELLADLSPEISAGLWNWLRLCNPGWKVTAVRPGRGPRAGGEPDERATAVLKQFLASLPGPYDVPLRVPFDTIVNQLFMGAFLRGAFMSELVLDENGRLPLNIATPDPYSARFKKMKHPQLGTVWQLGQYQGQQWTPLDRPTVRYVPIDPAPGRPYGRAIVSPALHTTLFLIGILHDLRRVVAQQGWPRINLEVDFEALAEMAPDDAKPGTEGFEEWVTAVIAEIETVYASLEPDDAYVHANTIKVNGSVGTLGAQALGMIDTLITKLERMAARAMKQMPLLLGIDESTTDANANRQWEIQAAGIKSIQHLCETMLEHLLGLALQAQGIQATVTFRFAELRAAEMLRDAMTEQLQITNEISKYNQGWISQDAASQAITGHDADQPAPRALELGGTADIVNPELDSGDGRLQLLEEIRAARLAVETAAGGRIIEPDEFAARFEAIVNRDRSPWSGFVNAVEIDGVRVWPNGRAAEGEK
jgi:hypothetical protein